MGSSLQPKLRKAIAARLKGGGVSEAVLTGAQRNSTEVNASFDVLGASENNIEIKIGKSEVSAPTFKNDRGKLVLTGRTITDRK